MIQNVTVTNYLGESITLELRNPEKSGFLIKEITGLGPVKANINMIDIATKDGSIYNSSKKETRNVVLNLLFVEKPTMEDTRILSYKYFPLGQQVRLLVKTDKREAYVTGYVEKNEPNIFSKEEGTQISIICPDPYFYSTILDDTTFFGVEPLFEFPFENTSLVLPTLEFAKIVHKKENTVYYSGDAPTGVTIAIHALGPVKDLTIYNINTRESMSINSQLLEEMTGASIIAGDDITICTVKGNKTITLLRNGIETNIINALGRNINWFQITKGDNIFSFTASEGDSNLQFSIQSQIIYEGV